MITLLMSFLFAGLIAWTWPQLRLSLVAMMQVWSHVLFGTKLTLDRKWQIGRPPPVGVGAYRWRYWLKTGRDLLPIAGAAGATYYIAGSGDDTTGTGSNASPWKTLSHALTACASGDTIVIRGSYVVREAVVLSQTFTSAVTIIGDEDGSRTGAAGEVRWTTFLNSDRDPGAGGIPLTLSTTAAAKGFLTIQGLTFVPATGVCINGVATSGVSNWNLTCQNCTFNTPMFAAVKLSNTSSSGNPAVVLLDSCEVMTTNAFLSLTISGGSSGDFDVQVEIRNCVATLLSGSSNFCTLALGSGSGTGKPGGVKLRNNTCMGGNTFMLTTGAVSTTLACRCTGNLIIGVTTAFNASATAVGSISEDNNFVCASTAVKNANVAAADATPHTIGSITNPLYAPLLEMGQTERRRVRTRQFLVPTNDSPFLNWGMNTAEENITVDKTGRLRPAGSGKWGTSQNSANPAGTGAAPAVGALERHFNLTRATGSDPVYDGTNAYKFTTPGDHELQVAVAAGQAVQITARCRFDSNYAGTPPQMTVLADPSLGILNDVVVTASAGALNAFELETLSLDGATGAGHGPIPTANGFLYVRLRSNDTSNVGLAIFDAFNVS